jgi:hypothetical protein
MMTISRCFGDFNKVALEAEMGEGCINEIRDGQRSDLLPWGGPDQRESWFICELEENTRYDLNLVFTNSPIGTSPSNIQPKCTTSRP